MGRFQDRVEVNGTLRVSAVIAVIAVGAFALYYTAVLIPLQGKGDTGRSATQTTSISQIGQASSSGTPSSVSQSATTYLAVAHTTTNFFNIEPQIHLVTLTPQNNTFTFTYNVTTWYSPVTLAFNQSKSYAQVYSNGTTWVSTSQPCKSNPATSTSVANGTSKTSTVTVDLRCGQPPNAGWNPVNGTLVNPHMEFTSSEIQVSLQPNTFAANYAGSLRITVTLNLKPGVYNLILVLGVQPKPSVDMPSWAQPPAFPVIVKSR